MAVIWQFTWKNLGQMIAQGVKIQINWDKKYQKDLRLLRYIVHVYGDKDGCDVPKNGG